MSSDTGGLKADMNTLKKTVTKINEKVDAIFNRITSRPFFKEQSPKQITEKGHKVLNKHSIDDFVNSCPFVNQVESLKDKEELKIYLECLNWVKNSEVGKNKVAEIRYENTITEEECHELCALAIRDKILSALKNS